jgi:hypothetical protein
MLFISHPEVFNRHLKMLKNFSKIADTFKIYSNRFVEEMVAELKRKLK